MRDTGCGIPEETLDHIFDPFYSTKFTGRGLGLAVAMSLVRAWSGMIHVNSEVNGGSCFRVFLPLAEDVLPPQPARMTKQEIFKAEGTVLLVDDDASLRMVVEAVLKNLGCTVFVAKNGSEAVTLFHEHQDSIDCLLTDLSMPDMDGWKPWQLCVKSSQTSLQFFPVVTMNPV